MGDETIKRMDIGEFRRLGYLQELNRRFLHPLGLALEVVLDSGNNGGERLGGIWDYRDDPEGMRFEGMDPDLMAERVAFVDEQWRLRESERVTALGYMVQPLPQLPDDLVERVEANRADPSRLMRRERNDG